MRTLTRAAASLCFAAAIAACGPGTMMVDPDATTDTGPGTDATPEAGDASTGPRCNGAPIENLDMLGTRAGATLTYAGTNADAPAATNVGLQVPRQAQSVCAFLVSHQRVFKYTPRSTGVIELSTSNMGTARNFDTVIIAANTMCRATPMVADLLNCNDDDPTFVDENRRVSSRTFATVTMGTPILIAVGTFAAVDSAATDMHDTGMFELTVKEVTTVPAGMACDSTGLTNTCAEGSDCVFNDYPPTGSTCRTPGSAPGASCSASDPCSAGLTCNMTSMICVRSDVPAGMRCDPLNQCALNTTCVGEGTLGAPIGTCRADGTVLGTHCRMGTMCDGALVCGTANTDGERFCEQAPGAMGACNSVDTACPGTATCVNTSSFGTVGVCTEPGNLRAPCGAGAMCTGAGVTCQTEGDTMACLRTAASGMPCGTDSVCATGTSCRVVSGDSAVGRCTPDGGMLGNCRATGTPCDAGLTCSDPMVPAEGTCIRTVGATDACGVGLSCPTGSTCAFDGAAFPGMLTGRCRAAGTAGARCRTTDSPCDAGLTCSTYLPNDGICQAAATAACDPAFGSNRCPTGQTCRATTASAGTCAAPIAETDGANNSATASQMITVPAAVTGSLGIGDLDCVRFAVPANGRVYAQINDTTGTCSYNADVQMVLYRLGGDRPVALGISSEIFNCSRIDPTQRPWATNLAAGNYAVCVRNTSTTRSRVPAYVLSVNAGM